MCLAAWRAPRSCSHEDCASDAGAAPADGGMARAQEVLSCQLAPGWTQSEAIHQYTADNLYDYKDGGAEGYLVYGFAGMKSLNCKSGDNTLTIDVSEMNDADAAYGIFASNRDPRLPIAKIGMADRCSRRAPVSPRESITWRL